ncbi:MAG: hypothetical protein GAK45_02144 [Pseudomonas citronellolis]|nr:MAG: hypothetical protein GAK45_02144 [Pseudomonas citronellolis]
MPALRWLFVVFLALLAACAQQVPQPTVSAQDRPLPPLPLAKDAQDCLSHSECTLKTSRTLLFVFDYASAGAPLVERDGRVLQTPVKAPAKGWPAIRIELPEAEGGRFVFASECRQKSCRPTSKRALGCYRAYLVGQSCAFR